MELPQEHKNEVSKTIVDTIISSLEQGFLSTQDYPLVADFVLDNMDNKVKTQEQLVNFLHELALKWKVFTHIFVIESNRMRAKDKNQIAENATQLAKNGQLEQALSLVKNATASQTSPIDNNQPTTQTVASVNTNTL